MPPLALSRWAWDGAGAGEREVVALAVVDGVAGAAPRAHGVVVKLGGEGLLDDLVSGEAETISQEQRGSGNRP